ncbi:MAG: hypothetical protein KAQ90_06430 [Melioribacteraceae bacterium]|nr:hypothetical protein [Melioribacteraceae bacterium]
MKKLLFALFLLTSTLAYSQDTFIELLRSDIQTQKKLLIADAMNFSEADAQKFWPIYREYEFEMAKLGDRDIANIKKYATNYDSLTNEIADELIEEAFDVDEEILDLNKDYYKKFKKALNPKIAGKAMQVINQINLLLQLQVASEIPLLPTDTE